MEDVSVIKKAAEMNAEHLLTHFDRIADAPDAIPRLRRFILDLAVRGKLVPQDPNDEPASELLKRIAAEKARLVSEKKISKQIPFLPFDLSEVLFDLPDSWAWCPSTYPSYIVSDKGKKVQTKDVFETGEFPVVDQGKVLIRGYHNDANKVICIKAPLVLFGDHTREMKLINFDFVVGADGVKLLQPVSLHTPYYFLALQWLPLESRGYGRHFKLLKASFIPLPPFAEQHRIVAKVDELMALCDRLEAARVEREATRNRMATASLARLNAPDPDPATFQNHTAFALNNLTPLTTRPDQIKALRQTILNLAVRGKLVPQNPNDKPASELLKRAKTTKVQAMIERKIRKSSAPELSESVGEDRSPIHWVWAHLHDFALVLGGKRLPSDTSFSAEKTGNIYIRVTDMKDGSISAEGLQYISDDVRARIAKYTIDREDLYITIAGTIGEVGEVPELFHGQNLTENAAKIVFREMDRKFLLLVLRSEDVQEQFQEKMKQMAQPKLALKRISGTRIPIPPLAEQHRIVAKVDELMALCDQLEASFATGNDTRRYLLDALLHKALGPGGNCRESVA